ncbi:hypothetical protein FRB96_006072 [Tulasnella sp. 330]|nr:hypothetical protein FRB96_006072 [Tulasnella sp. 330]KAG8875908.1 hypothetical protein FRB97_004644 [Tulasnella sp. 331]KAG8889533.1 hypothetical protein FRB98_004007 [Tulasnella sp. 332]
MIAAAGSPRHTQSIRSLDPPNPVAPVKVSSDNDRKAALSLAQRLLSANPSTPLPPLFPLSDPDLIRLNDQIYNFLALALRAFVLSWWSRLTPRDRDFLPQITIVLQHVIRTLHQRLQRADLAQMILVSFPALLQQHYTDYRQAQRKLDSSYANGATLASIHRVFHRLQPHIAIHLQDEGEENGKVSSSPECVVDPIYLTACVDLLLKECLPLDDSQSDLERSIVREIIVGPVLGGVLHKLSQSWFIYTMILDVLGPPQASAPPVEISTSQGATRSLSAFQSLIVVFLTTIQTISTVCLNFIHLSQSMVQLANSVNESSDTPLAPIRTRRQALSKLFSSSISNTDAQKPASAPRGLVYPSIELVKEVLDITHDKRENIIGVSIFNTLDLIAGFGEPFLDRLLPYLLRTKVLTATTLSTIVSAATQNLFPDSNNGYPGPPPVIPSAEEQAHLRQKLEERLKELVPGLLSTATTPECILDPLSSAECNIHLIVLLLDLVLVTLVPEFAVGGSSSVDQGPDVMTLDGYEVFTDAL